MSAKKKGEIALRLLREEGIENLSWECGVSVRTLSQSTFKTFTYEYSDKCKSSCYKVNKDIIDQIIFPFTLSKKCDFDISRNIFLFSPAFISVGTIRATI